MKRLLGTTATLLLLSAGASWAGDQVVINQDFEPDIPQLNDLFIHGNIVNNAGFDVTNVANQIVYEDTSADAGTTGDLYTFVQDIGDDEAQLNEVTVSACCSSVGVDGTATNVANTVLLQDLDGNGTSADVVDVDQSDVGDRFRQINDIAVLATTSPMGRITGAGAGSGNHLVSDLVANNSLNSVTYIDDGGGTTPIDFTVDQDLNGTHGLVQRNDIDVRANAGVENGVNVDASNRLNTVAGLWSNQAGSGTVNIDQDAGDRTRQENLITIEGDNDGGVITAAVNNPMASALNAANTVQVSMPDM